MENRLSIINFLSKKNNAQSYLELGVDTGFIFSHINIPTKIGVDPNPSSAANRHETSDEFFAKNTNTFDIIFIDGLHHANQVEKDINNGLKILNPNGYIICHDMLPANEKMQLVPRTQIEWTGDCWKAWVKIRSTRNDLSMYTIDIDYGCGVISFGQQDLISMPEDLSYENFVINKQEWMKIISFDKFISLYE